MHAKLSHFYPTTVKYPVLTGSWTFIALDNTACYTDLTFHAGTIWEKHAKTIPCGRGPVGSVRGTCPFRARLCRLGCGERFPRGAAAGAVAGPASSACSPRGPERLRSLCCEPAALETSRAVLWAFRNHFDCIWTWGGAWFEVSWARSLCWGFQRENRILLCHLNIRLLHAARFFFFFRTVLKRCFR